MIKHPENCGINHGSRCSCGMSELQAECDRLKDENGEQHRTIAFVNKELAFRRSECDRLKEELETARDGNTYQKKQKRKWKSIADRLAEVVDKEYINMDDVNTAYEALKSYNAVKGGR